MVAAWTFEKLMNVGAEYVNCPPGKTLHPQPSYNSRRFIEILDTPTGRGHDTDERRRATLN